MKIELVVDTLVLDGFPAGAESQITSALQTSLEEALATAAPGNFVGGARRTVSCSLSLPVGVSPMHTGQLSGLAIAERLGGGFDARASSGAPSTGAPTSGPAAVDTTPMISHSNPGSSVTRPQGEP